MTDEMIESIRKKAEAFPLVAFGMGTPPDMMRLYRLTVPGPGIDGNLGGASAEFSEAETVFISEARGDILALIAEVKRLKESLVDWYNEGFDAGKGEKKEWSDDSFRRGAEAMREAAARVAVSTTQNFYEDSVGNIIRALLIPEDK